MGMEVIIPEMPFEAIGIELDEGDDRTVHVSMGFSEEVAIDPFATAMVWLKTILELALDDGVSGAMNKTEYDILGKIATIVTQEGGMDVSPRVG